MNDMRCYNSNTNTSGSNTSSTNTSSSTNTNKLYNGRDYSKIEILVDLSPEAMKKDAWMTRDQFAYMIGKENIENVIVRDVESLGDAKYEPIVQVNMPGKEPVFYGNITSEKIYDILDNHIRQGKVIDDWVIQ